MSAIAKPDHETLAEPLSGVSGIDATRTVLTALFGPLEQRSFAVRFWNGTTDAPPGRAPRFTMVITRPGALRRMLLPPSEMSIIKAYLSGDVDVEGTLEAAADLGDVIANRIGSPAAVARLLPVLLRLPHDDVSELDEERRVHGLHWRGRQHTPTRDREAIRFHYDVGNDFYQLWLDPRMVYSCAYFERGDETLAVAQTAKLDHICRKLRLKRGERLLDIGCGWGGLIRFAAEHYGVRAVGITLSEAQAAFARAQLAEAGLSDRCDVQVCDYRELTDETGFDKVVSVGMVEHVGEARLPDYFAAAHRLLKAGGLFLNHGIISIQAARGSTLADQITGRLWQRGAFIDKYVFPDGDLVASSTVIAAAEGAGFEMRDVESLREHYAITLRHWVSRLEQNYDAAVQMVGEQVYRVWRLYMSASAHAFASGRIGIIQTLLAKTEAGGLANIPLTRRDIYHTA